MAEKILSVFLDIIGSRCVRMEKDALAGVMAQNTGSVAKEKTVL